MMLLAGEDCLTTTRGGAFSPSSWLLVEGETILTVLRKKTFSCQESAQIARSPCQVTYTAEVSPNFGNFPKSKILYFS